MTDKVNGFLVYKMDIHPVTSVTECPNKEFVQLDTIDFRFYVRASNLDHRIWFNTKGKAVDNLKNKIIHRISSLKEQTKQLQKRLDSLA